jgi:mRNA interferase MazF
LRRGDLVTIALAGDFGKPRPALVIQSDRFEEVETVTVLLVTTAATDAPLVRIAVEPDERNGLRSPSWIMIDKAMTVRRETLGPVFGRLDDKTMVSINRSLAVFLGFA